MRAGNLRAFGLICLGFLHLQVSAQTKSKVADQADPLKIAASKPTPHAVDGHPDLSGFWDTPSLNRTRTGFVDKDGVTYSPFFRKPGEAGRAAGQRPPANVPPYKPELVEKVKELGENAEKKDTKDPAFFCKPLGVPRIGHPRQIIQTPKVIVFLYQVDTGGGVTPGNAVRLIPMDGRKHRTDIDPLYFGDSIGHWEGNTLVVDVARFTDDTWLGNGGYIHSTALHVVERLTRKGDALHWEARVEDPNVLTKPWDVTPADATLVDDMVVEQPPCEERDLASYAP